MASKNPSFAKPIVAGLFAGLVFCTYAIYDFLGGWEDGANPYQVYADKLAGGLPTACGGLTKYITTTPIIVGEVWSPEKCQRERADAIYRVQQTLLQCFRQAPPQRVFDAATSHAWNFGAGATCSSGAMAAWNVGNWDVGCRRLQYSDDGKPVWSYIKDGKGGYLFVQGLANRRAAERRMCEGRT